MLPLWQAIILAIVGTTLLLVVVFIIGTLHLFFFEDVDGWIRNAKLEQVKRYNKCQVDSP